MANGRVGFGEFLAQLDVLLHFYGSSELCQFRDMQVTTTSYQEFLPFSSLLVFVFLWTKGHMCYMCTAPPIWEKMGTNRALGLDFLSPSPNNRDTIIRGTSLLEAFSVLWACWNWGCVSGGSTPPECVSLRARIFKAVYSLSALLPH